VLLAQWPQVLAVNSDGLHILLSSCCSLSLASRKSAAILAVDDS
jgi:hypothetical protein